MTFSTNAGGDGLDVGVVGVLRVGHDRGRVGVDQADLQALGAQHPAGLGARVVELAGLADDDRPGADHQHVVEVGSRRGTSALLSGREGAQLYGIYGVSMYKHARSRRCGVIGAGRHQVDELVEQVLRVVRAGGGLRVVLHRKRPSITESDALDDAVVGAGVADDGPAERRVEGLAGLPFQREPVVLRGDRDPAGGVVDDRDVDAAVTEHHLVRRQAQRPAQDLVAETDAEQRDSGAQHLPGEGDDVVGGGRVAGAVGQEHAVAA